MLKLEHITVRMVAIIMALTALVAASAISLRPADAQTAAGIALTKVVDWNDVAPYDVDFEICIASDTYDDCDTVEHGEVALFTNIPPGTYTVTEPGAGPLWSTQISQNPIVVTEESPVVNATVTNTHVNGGTLIVTKQVNWNLTTPDPTKLFNICITGTYYSDCENVTGGNSILWNDLPPGTYVVTESNPGIGWAQYSVSPSQNVTVASNDISTRTVTNTRAGGGRLDITKTVNWVGQTPIPGTTFQVCIASALHSECRAITPGATIAFGGIPEGQYTITEVNPGAGWGTPVITPNAVWVYNGQTSTATVANTRGGNGRLEVQKLVRWNGATPTTSPFEICIFGAAVSDCKEIIGAGVLVWDNLPAGPYSVTETNPGAGWGTPTIADSPVTVVNGQTSVVTVVNDRIPPTATPTATNTPMPTATVPPQTPTATATVVPPTATATATSGVAPGPPSTGSGLRPSSTVGLGLIMGMVLISGAAVLASRGRWKVER